MNYFNTWLSIHSSKISAIRDLEKFTDQEKILIFYKRPDLLSSELSKSTNNYHQYKDLSIELIINNFENISYFNRNQLIRLFNKQQDYEKIVPHLENFIISYKNVHEASIKDKNIFALIEKDVDLSRRLKNNIFYQLNILDNTTSFFIEKFQYFLEKTIVMYEKEDLTLEESNIFLDRVLKHLSIKDKKENNLPTNNIFSYLYKEKLKNKLENNLVNTNKINIKRKI